MGTVIANNQIKLNEIIIKLYFQTKTNWIITFDGRTFHFKTLACMYFYCSSTCIMGN